MLVNCFRTSLGTRDTSEQNKTKILVLMELNYFLVEMIMKIKHAPEQSKSSISIYFCYEVRDFHYMLSLDYLSVKCLH